MFSKDCELGLKTTIHLVAQTQKGVKQNQKEIAEAIKAPISETSKILKVLAKKDIIKSTKGPTGGYEIDQSKLDNISICCVVKAIDGEEIYASCCLGLKSCKDSNSCLIQSDYKQFQHGLQKMHETTKVKNFASNFKVTPNAF